MSATSTSAMHCAHCGRPVITALWVGGFPYHEECTRGPSSPTHFPGAFRTLDYGCMPAPQLTADDIRRIVREELERMNIVKDKSHD